MENASEALKIAFGMIMFVLALTLSLSSFSQAMESIDSIIMMKDKQTNYTYVKPADDPNKIVGVETIVPTMYKAYKENFKIIFLKQDGETPLYLYTYTDPNGNKTNVNYIDLEEEVVSNATVAINNLSLLLGKYDISALPQSYTKYYKPSMDIGTDGLYAFLSKNKFKELLGEYYQEDKEALNKGTTSDVYETNKTKKRIVTYILQ